MLSKQVVIVSMYDVSRPVAWSGIPHYLTKHLLSRKDLSITLFNPFHARVPEAALNKREFYRSFGQRYLWTRDVEWAIKGCQASSDMLRSVSEAHIVVFNPSDAAFLKTKHPITIIVDASWEQYLKEYERYDVRTLCEETRSHGLHTEQLGFARAANIICMTSWAAAYIAAIYPDLSPKLSVAHPGANLWPAPRHSEIREALREKESRKRKELLFVGAASERKGFDIALESCRLLRQGGNELTLNAVGFCSSTPKRYSTYVRTYDFLRKERALDYALLHALYLRSDVFLFPTRAECAGIVISEAAAYGLPVVTSGIGGSNELVIHGQTGLIVGADQPAKEYARRIATILEDKKLQDALSQNSRQHFDRKLNWDVFIDKMLSKWEERVN